MTQTQETTTDADVVVITPELVAKTITGISQIGSAHNALANAGWHPVVSKNRIIVDGIIEAQLLCANTAMWWNVYSVDGTPPIFTVGAHRVECDWIGCVE